MKKLLFILIVALGISSCDDEVDIPLKDTTPFLNVDAWLTNTGDTQQIVLNYTRPYFDNGAPEPALAAEVIVVDIETLEPFVFSDEDDDGIYVWVPAPGEVFGEVGHSYGLQISVDGQVYQSFSTLNAAPSVDSITFEYNKKDAFIEEDYYYAEFWARDFEGPGNTYWVKSFVNDTYLGKPEQINIAYDAGFSAGGEVDSLIFIQPIRTAITPFPTETPAVSPFKRGDKLRVELHAIPIDAWFFLYRVQDETVRQPGFAQLFANPLANSPTNIVPTSDDVSVVGFFSVAGVSSLEVIMSDENIVDRVPD
ncbi:DUF4249 family protein [Marinoscillum sp. 108]|uniref:DUF4249 family protein n=1 Tax=Marinoscillum sp. 108 TaxID=2653151 RepID=UPI0012EFE952|nr:DUF4249 family protein [Marinoscillum sp. 108]VXD18639.1 conserved hypothetical protein [Marinoscillum sp. 108]